MEAKSLFFESSRSRDSVAVYFAITKSISVGGPNAHAHTFVYHLAIANFSDRTVTLLGRKWILTYPDGTREIVEGDGIVGETPTLRPGEVFRYHSQHVAGGPLRASGAFHGKDASGAPLHVRIPEFAMDPGAA